MERPAPADPNLPATSSFRPRADPRYPTADDAPALCRLAHDPPDPVLLRGRASGSTRPRPTLPACPRCGRSGELLDLLVVHRDHRADRRHRALPARVRNRRAVVGAGFGHGSGLGADPRVQGADGRAQVRPARLDRLTAYAAPRTGVAKALERLRLAGRHPRGWHRRGDRIYEASSGSAMLAQAGALESLRDMPAEIRGEPPPRSWSPDGRALAPKAGHDGAPPDRARRPQRRRRRTGWGRGRGGGGGATVSRPGTYASLRDLYAITDCHGALLPPVAERAHRELPEPEAGGAAEDSAAPPNWVDDISDLGRDARRVRRRRRPPARHVRRAGGELAEAERRADRRRLGRRLEREEHRGPTPARIERRRAQREDAEDARASSRPRPPGACRAGRPARAGRGRPRSGFPRRPPTRAGRRRPRTPSSAGWPELAARARPSRARRAGQRLRLHPRGRATSATRPAGRCTGSRPTRGPRRRAAGLEEGPATAAPASVLDEAVQRPSATSRASRLRRVGVRGARESFPYRRPQARADRLMTTSTSSPAYYERPEGSRRVARPGRDERAPDWRADVCELARGRSPERSTASPTTATSCRSARAWRSAPVGADDVARIYLPASPTAMTDCRAASSSRRSGARSPTPRSPGRLRLPARRRSSGSIQNRSWPQAANPGPSR